MDEDAVERPEPGGLAVDLCDQVRRQQTVLSGHRRVRGDVARRT